MLKSKGFAFTDVGTLKIGQKSVGRWQSCCLLGEPPPQKKSDQMSQRSSLKDRSLNVFSKCLCHWHWHSICLCRCLFVGQFMFSHYLHQFCMVSVWSGRPEGFVSITANMTERSISKVGLELPGQLNIIMRKPAVSSSSLLIRMMIGTKANPHSSVAASAKNWIQIAPPWIHKPPTPSHHNHYDEEEEDRSASSFYNCMVKIMNWLHINNYNASKSFHNHRLSQHHHHHHHHWLITKTKIQTLTQYLILSKHVLNGLDRPQSKPI